MYIKEKEGNHDFRKIANEKGIRISAGNIQRQMQRIGSNNEDEIHQPLIEDFRRSQGLPPGGYESGQAVGPSDAEIKYHIFPETISQIIITIAEDKSKDKAIRAKEVVKLIIRQYYASDESKVDAITFDSSEPGLGTKYTGIGQNIKGIITVGDYFLLHTKSEFARRVAQVGHELEHIDQERAGMRGSGRKDEREFLAFYHEALFVERRGTGTIRPGTRIHLIDTAIGYYHCLGSTLQQQFLNEFQELIRRRPIEVTASREVFGPPPTGCRKQL